MKLALLLVVAVVLAGAVLAARTMLIAGGAETDTPAKFGALPTAVFPDGSTGVDPNKLGIGPEGVTATEPSAQAALADTLAKIPSDHTLRLENGVVGVVMKCMFPHPSPFNDPDAKCFGLHDTSGLSVVSLKYKEGTIDVIGWSDRSPASTAKLQAVLDDPATWKVIVEFLQNASVD